MTRHAVVALAILITQCEPVFAAETKDLAAPQLNALVARIQTRLNEGAKTESDISGELKELDALLARHQGEKTDEVAQILSTKALIYLQAFNNPAKSIEVINQIKRDYPDTRQGKSADRMLAFIRSLQEQMDRDKLRESFAIGTKFPDFKKSALAGNPLSIANFKGKIVLVDFWATWCGICVAELPNMLKTYGKYHGRGFEIIGISMDADEAKLTAFVKENRIPWQQFCDGKSQVNTLADQYGINPLPCSFLLDGDGIIIARDLRGEALEKALAKAVGEK